MKPADIKAKIGKLENDIERVNESIAELEGVAARAKGPVSPLFQSRIDEIRMHRERMEERLSELRLEDAEVWADQSLWDGYTAVWDDLLGRAFRLIDKAKDIGRR
ncbi:MAG: hypothetical protein ACR2RB_19655 [Gammaproteobacteria bacterium]